jgi:hypothetical protein
LAKLNATSATDQVTLAGCKTRSTQAALAFNLPPAGNISVMRIKRFREGMPARPIRNEIKEIAGRRLGGGAE